MRNKDELLLTFFYCGKAKKFPGTVASFASVLLWFLLTVVFLKVGVGVFLQTFFWGIVVFSAFVYAVANIPSYVKRISPNGDIDHKSITIDEFIGQIIALQVSFIPLEHNYSESALIMVLHPVLSFVCFRYFDIKKPSIIGEIDRQLKNEMGVVFDDVISGVAAAAVTSAILLIF